MPLAERRVEDRRALNIGPPNGVERRAAERRRGRPRQETALVKFLILRLSLAQRARIVAAARLNQQSLTDFVRDAIEEAVADCSDDTIFR